MGRKLSVPPVLNISEAQKSGLQKIATARSTPLQISKRVSVLLLISEGTPYSVAAKETKLSLNTVKSWRKRWDEFKTEIDEAEQQMGLEVALQSFLQDKARSGQPRKFSDLQIKQIVAMACDKPTTHGLPMTDWTFETLAVTAQEKGIVESISKSHLRLLLKNTTVATA